MLVTTNVGPRYGGHTGRTKLKGMSDETSNPFSPPHPWRWAARVVAGRYHLGLVGWVHRNRPWAGWVGGERDRSAGDTRNLRSPALHVSRRDPTGDGQPAGQLIRLTQRQTSDTQQQRQVLAALTCTPGQPDLIADQDDSTKPLITCDQQGTTKYILGPSFLDGNQIRDATAGRNLNGTGYVVNVTFKSADASTWATYTSANVGKQAAFVLDSQVVSAPTIQQAILGDNTQISGNFTQQQARDLANTLSGR
jgi:hypothetical protein